MILGKSEILSEKEQEFCLNLLNLFKIDGAPANEVVTEGQLDIFGAIVLKKSPRIHIMTCTQYGKSLTVALACIVLSCIEGELISIPAPTEDKARIIMRYYLQHMGDHPLFYSQLEREDKVDKLIMETSRDRLVLKNRGGVFILSVHAGDSQKGFEAAMGLGSATVIQDESALIPDSIEATVFRMIVGKKNAMYVKIGNPFYRDAPYSHFYKSSIDPNYLHIEVDYLRALKEGRYRYEDIEEARGKPNFEILYGCKFPSEDGISSDGYLRLLTPSELKNAQVAAAEHSGFSVLGVDPAAGGDNSTIVLKSCNNQEVLFNKKLPDVMALVGITADLYRATNASMIVVDKTGIGQGVFDRLREMGFPVRGLNFGEKAENSDAFYNLKAELYWNQRKWLLSGGRLIANPGWSEFDNIRYKNKDGRVLIQPKEELFKLGIKSPNCVDAAVLTMGVTDNAIRSARQLQGRQRTFHDQSQTIWRG